MSTIVFVIAHGTYIGSIRIESNKPTQLPVDSQFHFGASTRMYILRERPQAAPKPLIDDKSGEEVEGGLLGLPETETELDVSTIQVLIILIFRRSIRLIEVLFITNINVQ